MDSQVDLFASQPVQPVLDQVEIDLSAPSSSCPPRLGQSSKWVIVFEWDEGVEEVFKVYLISYFGSEIQESWITSVLSSASRQKKLKFSRLEGKTVSLFGKIDRGNNFLSQKKKFLLHLRSYVSYFLIIAMTVTQRSTIKQDLNARYLSLIQVQNQSIGKAYQTIVDENPYTFQVLPIEVSFWRALLLTNILLH